MNLNVEYRDGSVLLKNTKDFNIKQVFECGQCFRWEKQTDNSYIGVAFGKVIEGIEVVDQIAKVRTTPSDKPYEAVVIESIEVVDEPVLEVEKI